MILTIIGIRPEAIKLAPVVLEIKQKHDSFVSKVCLTAQHREMLDQPLALFGIRPDYDLNIMSPGQTLAQITVRAVKGLDEIVAEEKPDVLSLCRATQPPPSAGHWSDIIIRKKSVILKPG